MDFLTDAFGSAVWTPVPLAIKVAEACAFGLTVFEHAPGSPVALALGKIGERVVQNSGL
jgi:hypothetical protein